MRNLLGFATLAVAVSGCTTIPAQLMQSDVSPREIRQAIECEVAYALQSGTGDVGSFANWLAAIQLETTLTDTVTSKPGINVSGSIGKVDYKVPASVDYSDVRKGHSILHYDDLKLSDASTVACPQRNSPLAATGLRLADYLEQAGSTLTNATSGGGTLQTLEFEIDFSVTRGVSGGLTFKDEHVQVSWDENSVSRGSANVLTIAFSAPKPGESRQKTVQKLQDKITYDREQRNTIQLRSGQSIIIQ